MLDLWELLDSKPTLMVAGAFDGLSAVLVETSRFDAVWASGFCISTSRAIPDMSILTVSDLLTRVGEMTGSVSIPIIVDCDEGYGSLTNTLDLVKQLVDMQVQGICIEDNSYPKLNSFLKGGKRSLVSTESFGEKLRAVRNIAPGLVLIARTEALIAGMTVEEAVKRGQFYAESGANLVLLHSDYTTLSEFKILVSKWNCVTPLVAIPTMSPHISFDQLSTLGFRVIIYANQGLRASVYHCEKVLRSIRATGSLSAVHEEIVSMDRLFTLTGTTAYGFRAQNNNANAGEWLCRPISSGQSLSEQVP
jgi:phosphoenolpyruvate phosphomutase